MATKKRRDLREMLKFYIEQKGISRQTVANIWHAKSLIRRPAKSIVDAVLLPPESIHARPLSLTRDMVNAIRDYDDE